MLSRRSCRWGSYVNPVHRRKPSHHEASLAKCLRRFEQAVFSSLALSIHHDSRAAGSQLLRAMHSIWRHKPFSHVASSRRTGLSWLTSTSTSLGSRATSTVDRAGVWSPMCLAYTPLNGTKSPMFFRKAVGAWKQGQRAWSLTEASLSVSARRRRLTRDLDDVRQAAPRGGKDSLHVGKDLLGLLHDTAFNDLHALRVKRDGSGEEDLWVRAGQASSASCGPQQQQP